MDLLKVLKIAVLLFLLLLFVWLLWRREKCRQKICRMGKNEKIALLNELIHPFGFAYDANWDIFVSLIHAWQRKEGYEALFDRLASRFNMVIDAFPVYFDYRGKTWMIEFWKGQYGINTGAEVGVYHANRLAPKEQRRKIHYNAVSDEEMPLLGICLERKERRLFTRKGYHWWLTAFKMGMFSEPKDLVLRASITFADSEAAQAFCEGFLEAGYAPDRYRIRNRRVTVLFDQTQTYRGMEKLYRKLVQEANRFYCMLYRIVSRPFTSTLDRTLFLYEQLPWCFRHMLRLHSFGRKKRVKR